MFDFPKQKDPRLEESEEIEGDLQINKWRRKTPNTKDYEEARPGDHLLTPFQCDRCVFRRLRQEEPKVDSLSDQALLCYIRRVNLDAFWSRSRNTVRNNRLTVARNLKSLEALGLSGPYYDPGPTPTYDHLGYEVAISVVVDTLRPGKYHTSHKQWDSSRKVKSAIGNFERVRMSSNLHNLALVDDNKGSSSRFHWGDSASYWYQRFAQGCRNRMGQDIRKDLGLSTDLWKLMLTHCEKKMREGNNFDEIAKWTIAGSYLAFIYVLSLRGPEGFQFSIKELMQTKNLKNGLVQFPIIGKVKGDSFTGVHLLRSVPVTSSGIDVLLWRNKLLRIHELAGREDGPAICDSDGFLMNTSDMNECMWEILEDIYEIAPEMFPTVIIEKDQIRDMINIDRSGRRTSESRALSKRVAADDREIVNRWSSIERAKGKAPSEPMRIAYAQQYLLDECFRRYTSAM